MNKSYQDSTFSTNEARADPLEALARQGSRQMLQFALEAEVSEYLQRPRYERGERAEHRGYRNGYLPERSLTRAQRRDFGQSSARQ
jgi:transposase-like protein